MDRTHVNCRKIAGARAPRKRGATALRRGFPRTRLCRNPHLPQLSQQHIEAYFPHISMQSSIDSQNDDTDDSYGTKKKKHCASGPSNMACGSGSGDVACTSGSGDVACTSGSGDVACTSGSGDVACTSGSHDMVCTSGSDDVACTSGSGDVACTSGSGNMACTTCGFGDVAFTSEKYDENDPWSSNDDSDPEDVFHHFDQKYEKVFCKKCIEKGEEDKENKGNDEMDID